MSHEHSKIYLHAKCHMEGNLCAYTDGQFLYLECAECEQQVAKLRLKNPFPHMRCDACESEEHEAEEHV